MKKTRKLIKYIFVFLGIMLLQVVMLICAFSIPDHLIQVHQETSLYISSKMEESIWFGNFFGKNESRLDGETDIIMIKNVIPDNNSLSLLQKTMFINDYARYWHGYLVYLRPLMVFFNYWEIRYINMIFFFVSFAAVVSMLSKRIEGLKGIGASITFALSITMCYIVILAVSLQYYSVFLIMMIASIIILGRKKMTDYPMFFLVIGIVTNFVDFLTVPLLTLGMPLLILLFIKHNEDEHKSSFFEEFRYIICQSIAWGLGYGGCWVFKWILAALILPGDIVTSVSGHASFWLSDAGAGTRMWAFKLNVPYYFMGHGIKIAVLALMLPIVLGVLGRIFPKRLKVLPFSYLVVGCAPYAWYYLLNGHAFYHAWFTYRLQAITLFAICLFFLELIDFNRLKIGHLKENKDDNKKEDRDTVC